MTKTTHYRETPAAPSGLDFADVVVMLRRERWLIATITLLCMVIFVGSSSFMAKRFKSSAELTIYPEYFQNPLVRDFIPETYDSAELRAQREALVRSTFDAGFVDGIGEKYGFYKSPADTTQRILERQEFEKRFEVIMVGGTSVDVAFSGSDPAKVFNITRDMVERVKSVLNLERRKTVEGLRNSMRQRLDAMAAAQQPTSEGGPDETAAPGQVEQLQKQLANTESQLKNLKNRFTPLHPAVQRLQAKANQLRAALRTARHENDAPLEAGGEPINVDDATTHLSNTPAVPSAPARDSMAGLGGGGGANAKEFNREVYDDLVKKLGYLNIVLEMDRSAESKYISVVQPPNLPTSAIFPRRSVFALWGLMTGILISFFVVLIREYFARSALSMESFADRLGIRYLGSAPQLNWSSPLSAAAAGSGRRATASPTASPTATAVKVPPKLPHDEWN